MLAMEIHAPRKDPMTLHPPTRPALRILAKRLRVENEIGMLALAWPGFLGVLDRLADYLGDVVPSASGKEPLLHACMDRCAVVVQASRDVGLTSTVIRHAVASLIVHAGDVVHWRVCRDGVDWNPTLGLPVSAFLEGCRDPLVERCAATAYSRDDAILAVGGHLLGESDRVALNRDVQALVSEYRRVWPEA